MSQQTTEARWKPVQLATGFRVAFDTKTGIEPLAFPADTTTQQIASEVHRAFLAADIIRDGHEFSVVTNIEAGTVVVSVDGNVIEDGSIYRIDPQPEPEPDHWLAIAADLRQVADRIATLAGTGKPTSGAAPVLYVYSDYSVTRADQSTSVVDALAAAFNTKAQTKSEGRGQNRSTERKMATDVGQIHVFARASMPNPPTRQQTRAALEARVAELEEQLANGGAR